MEKGITKLSVAGFKSIAKGTTLDIRSLTLLAGANSSGKSSFMQPLLLLKQTLESPYDPGLLLLNGANVKFTSFDQILTIQKNKSTKREFTITVESSRNKQAFTFSNEPSKSEKKPWFEFIVNSREKDIYWSVKKVIHIPGLRGNPERIYQAAGVGPTFPGTFEHYTASVISHWEEKKSDKLQQLCSHLALLGLTSQVSANRLNDAQIEIKVGRLPKNGRSKKDMVNIADVGFGVSQTLPVLVALLVAEPGQLVYLEQPEIHLHPRAQRILAEILVDAANRGVKVVAETHSSLLLLAVQTLIAKKIIDKDDVALHWFERDKLGMTNVTTADIDEAGCFGDWPVDFGDVELEAEGNFIEAVALTRKER